MTDELFKHVFAQPLDAVIGFLKGNSWIAWALLALIVVWNCLGAFEGADILRARIIAPLARWSKFRWLARAAAKYDVRGHVNQAINTIAAELPDGWITDIDLKYVNGETRAEFFANNKPVVHIRPFEDQERNVVTVINVFLREALFGNVRHIIPDLQRTAAVLYFGDRIALSRSEATAKAFGEYVLEPAVKGKDKILQYYQRYSGIDQRGLFSGPFIREIKHVAEEVRASRFHNKMAEEMNAALTHLEEFANAYQKSREERVPMGVDAWVRKGIVTKYALMLVANPLKAATDEQAAYVRRALAYSEKGIKRIYVLGASGEWRFASKVINAIAKDTPYVIEQRFALYKDYRGDAGGIGAVFVAKPPYVAGAAGPSDVEEGALAAT
jgi:hypothetical protein